MGCTKGGCSTGCSRLGVTDWLENMLPPGSTEAENIYEIRFKTTRKAFYRNVNNLDVITGDTVVVASDRGYDVGTITMGGELARLQMRKKRVHEEDVHKIYRLATAEDTEQLEKARAREYPTLLRARELTRELNLRMKVTDVEFQGDGTKAYFYFTADKRVDFRQLVRQLATELKVRIEMKQIGSRQEAGVIGGIGACGRELCCSTFLTHFKSVNTSAARYQNLSLNPSKITGLCGRLKCCLNYELDTYLDALKHIPKATKLETAHGPAFLQKTDIFRQLMWYSYPGESNWICLTAQQVQVLKDQIKAGKKPANLGEYHAPLPEKFPEGGPEPDFVDVVGQSNLHERTLPSKPKKRRKSKTVVKGPGKDGVSTTETGQQKDTASGKPRNKRRGRGRNKGGSRSGNGPQNAQGPKGD